MKDSEFFDIKIRHSTWPRQIKRFGFEKTDKKR